MPANVYNANWFASNLVRKYPLDSISSCIDMYGNYLPDTIITDIQISYPQELGDYCYVAAVNITDNLVSVILYVDTVPVASLCTSRPIDEGRYYSLEPLYDGVRGVMSLGVPVSQEAGKWVFSDKTSSRVLPTCCSPYKPAAVLSLSRPNDSDPLQGNVLLTSGNDIQLKLISLNLPNANKAIFVGLDRVKGTEEVLKSYLSLCDVSTEMNNCSRRYITAMGGATPSCSGDIEIVSDPNGTIEVINDIGDGIILIKSNRQLKDVCRDSSPFSINEDGEGKNKCPFPTVRSDDICPAKSAGQGTSYPPDTDSFTDIDLRKDTVEITSGGLLYDSCNEGSITPASENEVTQFEVKVDPTSKFQVSIKFPELSSTGMPLGSIRIDFGNDSIVLDRGKIAYIVDSGSTAAGDSGHDNEALRGVSKLSINYTNTELYLYYNNYSYHLANLDDGMAHYERGIDFKIKGPICIEGIRYV